MLLRAHAFFLSANGATDSRCISHPLKIHTEHLKTVACMRAHTHIQTHTCTHMACTRTAFCNRNNIVEKRVFFVVLAEIKKNSGKRATVTYVV